ncbi:hypothetical protein CFOL_v3_25162, partial [Cephalotus follicularis]
SFYRHIKNPYSQFLFIIEPGYQKNCKIPLDIAKRIFSKEWNFYSDHPKKTQIFYEFILVDTDSIKISPKSDPNNPELITHTSVFIQKIITIAQWGQPPHHYKHFSSSFDILVYNYFDYIQAWHHAFLFQNIEERHSWFFCIDKTFNAEQIIPYWFMDWWTFYGPN